LPTIRHNGDNVLDMSEFC